MSKSMSINCQKMWAVLSVLFVYLCSACGHVSGDEYMRHFSQTKHIASIMNITYKDPVTGEMVSERNERGRYGVNSREDNEWGMVVHVRTTDNQTHGCSPPINVPKERWIALIERGSCKFTDKIHNSAVVRNASAVVIYNHKDEDELLTMSHNVDDVVSIFIYKSDGERIANLVDNNTKVMMYISVGGQVGPGGNQINKTSVLFVSISFIVLMIISLAWLVFYYIQRFRYAHAKERLSKRLMHAAKKAISKMPVRTVKSGDRETDAEFDPCAVCIDSFKISDVIRILPCKHTFHKSCVEPWLIEQRSCPMCKLDILKAYGLQIHGSRDSLINIEVEGPSTSLGPFDILAPDVGREFDNNGVEVIRFQPAQSVRPETPVAASAKTDDPEGSHTKASAKDSAEVLKESENTEAAGDAVITEGATSHREEEEEEDVTDIEISSLLKVAGRSTESISFSVGTEHELLVRKSSKKEHQRDGTES